jgi:hypothetical protein
MTLMMEDVVAVTRSGRGVVPPLPYLKPNKPSTEIGHPESMWTDLHVIFPCR